MTDLRGRVEAEARRFRFHAQHAQWDKDAGLRDAREANGRTDAYSDAADRLDSILSDPGLSEGAEDWITLRWRRKFVQELAISTPELRDRMRVEVMNRCREALASDPMSVPTERGGGEDG